MSERTYMEAIGRARILQRQLNRFEALTDHLRLGAVLQESCEQLGLSWDACVLPEEQGSGLAVRSVIVALDNGRTFSDPKIGYLVQDTEEPVGRQWFLYTQDRPEADGA